MMECNALLTNRKRSGFTLTELLLAMLVFAIAITTILALLARSIETVDEVLLKDEAMRLSGAVEDFYENSDFNTSYIGYKAISRGNRHLVAFNYRGIPNQAQADGSLEPYTELSGVAGEDYVLTPYISYVYPDAAQNTILEDNLDALEGRLFLVDLELSPNNPAVFNVDPDRYNSAVLVLFAEYYPVSSLNNLDVDALGISPAYSYTFAIRR